MCARALGGYAAMSLTVVLRSIWEMRFGTRGNGMFKGGGALGGAIEDFDGGDGVVG